MEGEDGAFGEVLLDAINCGIRRDGVVLPGNNVYSIGQNAIDRGDEVVLLCEDMFGGDILAIGAKK